MVMEKENNTMSFGRNISVIVCSLAFYLYGCNTYDDYVLMRNSEPIITLASGSDAGQFIQDSVKLSNAEQVFVTEIEVRYEDINNNISRLEIASLTEDVFIIQEDTILIDEFIIIESTRLDTVKLEFLSFATGIKELSFTLIDHFQEHHEASIQLVVFDNIIPVVMESHNIDNETKIIDFNLSASFDPDSIYGGEVLLYELIFNGQTFEKTEPTMQVVYSDDQIVYDYSVRVMDNNFEYSAAKVRRIRIEP
jgi:hypothetical protein